MIVWKDDEDGDSTGRGAAMTLDVQRLFDGYILVVAPALFNEAVMLDAKRLADAKREAEVRVLNRLAELTEDVRRG